MCARSARPCNGAKPKWGADRTVKPPHPQDGAVAIRTFEDFREAVFAYRLPRVILTALDLNLFTVVGGKRWTIPALAAKLRVSRRGLDILCRNLAAAGLLVKRGSVYRNGPLGLAELNAKSPAHRGAYLDLLKGQWAEWSQLTTHVRSGKPLDADEPDEPAYRRRFSWAMHHRSLVMASEVAAQLDLAGAETLLDLGGGPGTYALAFLARNPRLRATVCDRAPALDVARCIAKTVPHGTRLSYLPVDFMREPVPGRYDTIWYSNVLHIYSPDENRRLFRRLLRALNPGGRLLIHDAFLHDREGLYPLESGLFAVTMLLATERGDIYPSRSVAQWLRETGFARVTKVSIRKGTGDWDDGILEARVPSRSRSKNPARRRRSREN